MDSRIRCDGYDIAVRCICSVILFPGGLRVSRLPDATTYIDWSSILQIPVLLKSAASLQTFLQLQTTAATKPGSRFLVWLQGSRSNVHAFVWSTHILMDASDSAASASVWYPLAGVNSSRPDGCVTEQLDFSCLNSAADGVYGIVLCRAPNFKCALLSRINPHARVVQPRFPSARELNHRILGDVNSMELA